MSPAPRRGRKAAPTESTAPPEARAQASLDAELRDQVARAWLLLFGDVGGVVELLRTGSPLSAPLRAALADYLEGKLRRRGRPRDPLVAARRIEARAWLKILRTDNPGRTVAELELVIAREMGETVERVHALLYPDTRKARKRISSR